ncbi:MAG: aminopeptidase P N-terminal domain-containing protein [Bdellovibrionales bacterium]
MRKSRINVEFYKARRRKLAQLIPGSAVVLPAWPEQYRNADTHYVYRPESSLYYLTGYEEPESVLIFRPGRTPETIMFVREKNVEMETWEGFRFGLEGAKEVFGFDKVYAYEDFAKIAPELLRGSERVYYTMFRNKEFDEVFGHAMLNVHGWRAKQGAAQLTIEDSSALLGEMRIRKSEEEIEAMQMASRISAEAHVEVMKRTKAGVTERTLQGVFIKEIMERDAFGEAYPSIVATGNNATTLHYRFNESILKSGEMLLIDAGAEYLYYSGDITRTYPVNGKFSPVQKRIYGKILKLQKELCTMVKPGLPFADLQKYTVTQTCQILAEEKLLKGTPEEIEKSAAYRKYYPHGVSHLLGLDTHDLGSLLAKGEPRPLEAGWCLTIEPGLYFPANDTSIPEEFRGIGIRIEDDLLVTPDGCEVMTRGVPKEIDEMEALIGAKA